MKKINSVEHYLNQNESFKATLQILRDIILDTELEEHIKWNAPVYSLKHKNILGIGAFKNHCCLWFFNGIYLKDHAKILHNAQPDKTKALRQIRFTSKTDINKALITTYIHEAITNQKDGKEIKPQKKTKTIAIPKELIELFLKNKALEEAFKKLSQSKQNEYSNYITLAKRTLTKKTRLDKITPLILKGDGLLDKYKNCKTL